MRSSGFRFDTSNEVVDEWRVRREELLALLHHHLPHSLRRERHRPLTRLISLRLELLVLLKHGEEPCVGVSGHRRGTDLRFSPPVSVSLSPGIKVAPFNNDALFVGVAGSFPLGDEELSARLKASLFYHF